MVPVLELDSFHTAFLDPASGYGLLVCPRPETDVWLDGHSVYEASWEYAMSRLTSVGWAPVRDAADFLSYLGGTEGGDLVVEVRCYRSKGSVPEGAVWRDLCRQTRLLTDPEHVRPTPG